MKYWAVRAVARKETSQRDIWRARPCSVAYESFAFQSISGLSTDALEVLSRVCKRGYAREEEVGGVNA